MAGELQCDHDTGKTVYFLVRNSAGQIWNGAAFVAYVAGNIATYDIAAAEQGASGYYVANMPTVAQGTYSVVAREQAGGDAAESDRTVGTGSIEWTGTAIATALNGDQTKAEIVEALTTDTYAELGSVPPATTTLMAKLTWIYMLLRNKRTQDASSGDETLFSDGGAAPIATSEKTDSSGVFTRDEWD